MYCMLHNMLCKWLFLLALSGSSRHLSLPGIAPIVCRKGCLQEYCCTCSTYHPHSYVTGPITNLILKNILGTLPFWPHRSTIRWVCLHCACLNHQVSAEEMSPATDLHSPDLRVPSIISVGSGSYELITCPFPTIPPPERDSCREELED